MLLSHKIIKTPVAVAPYSKNKASLHNVKEALLKLIPLYGKYGLGRHAYIDDADYPHLSKFRWIGSIHGYAVRGGGGGGRKIYMHRQILSPLPGYSIDHKNGDKLDNRRSNLRVCTQAENVRNQTVLKTDNKSGYRGVHRDKSGRRWVAQCKHRHVGTFDSAREAAIAYNHAATRAYGSFASLNEISGESPKTLAA